MNTLKSDIVVVGGVAVVVGVAGYVLYRQLPSWKDVPGNIADVVSNIAVYPPIQFGKRIGDAVSKGLLGYTLSADELAAAKKTLDVDALTQNTSAWVARQFWDVMRYDIECSGQWTGSCTWANADQIRKLLLSHMGAETSTPEFRQQILYGYWIMTNGRNMVNDIDLYMRNSTSL